MGKPLPVTALLFSRRDSFSLLLCFVLILSVVSVSSYPSNYSCDDYSNEPDIMSTGQLNLYNAVQHQKLNFYTHLNLLKNPSLEAFSLHQLREFCFFQTANSLIKSDVARGYDCLAQLHLKNSSNSELEIYKAIKSASVGLETFYSKSAALNLKKLIVSGYENEVSFVESNRTNIAQCCTGYRKEEEMLLESILRLNISSLNARVLYRKSLINTFGRSSAREVAKKTDLKLSIEQLNYVRKVSQIQQKNYLDIVMVFNEKYAVHAATTMLSALMNSDLDSFYRFHIVMDPDDPISESSKSKLASYTHVRKYSVDFTIFPNELLSEELKQKMKFNHKWPLMVVYRLFLGTIFPKLESVVYLDADLVVFRDLNALKSIDMSSSIWGGATDARYHPTHFECNTLLPHFYINVGVLIVNLKNMRDLDSHRMLLDNLPNFEKCCFYLNDQDVINTVFADYVNYIPFRWNSQILPENAKSYFAHFIVHYITHPKPWAAEFETSFRNNMSRVPSHIQHYWRYRDVVGWQY